MCDEILYEGARFYKCALQVNPYSYAAYRGVSPSEENSYNTQILKQCQKNKIEVVGLADHGDVESSIILREHLKSNAIVVFPGFEICSSEKVHFVCLFSESSSQNDLIGYISKLEINANEKTSPSKLNATQILNKVGEMSGIAFAAHCTDDNGILKHRLNNIWRDPSLMIAQIKHSVIDLQDVESGFYYRVLLNKEDNYKRNKPVAIINAMDVSIPEDLGKKSASCLVKMTTPTFQAFKKAFHDPESRIRLNHDLPEQPYSVIHSVEWQGAGFFTDSSIALSKHLNTIIGGRGTGKTTLLESIRYALDLSDRGENHKTLESIRRTNFGNSTIILNITSKAQQGQRYTISRRFGESPIIQNDQGDISHLTVGDLLPDIEFLGQNEILEIEKDENAKLALIHNFLPDSFQLNERIADIKHKLANNRNILIKAKQELDDLESKIAQEEKLKEQVTRFQELGIEGKLQNTQLLEKEKVIQTRTTEQLDSLEKWVADYKTIFDLTFLQDGNIENLPNKENIVDTRKILQDLQKILNGLIGQAGESMQKFREKYQNIQSTWQVESGKIRDELNAAIAQLPGQAGKTGKALGAEYVAIIKHLTLIEQQKKEHERQKNLIRVIASKRMELLEEYRSTAFNRFNGMNTAVKKLNKGYLKDRVKISVVRCGNVESLKDFLLKIDGIGQSKIQWLDEPEIELDLVDWSKWIKEKDESAFMDKYRAHGLTKNTVDKLLGLDLESRLILQEIELNDVVGIELNTAHEGKDTHYVSLDNLSTGQKCTAILNLLLLSRDDPLIIDQPEDNLDNAFIAERIVQDLRKFKTNRQFLFATHNANIPVFGDAELIAVLDSNKDRGTVKHIGSIDKPEVGSQAAEILEGGKAAFTIRKDKYGF